MRRLICPSSSIEILFPGCRVHLIVNILFLSDSVCKSAGNAIFIHHGRMSMIFGNNIFTILSEPQALTV